MERIRGSDKHENNPCSTTPRKRSSQISTCNTLKKSSLLTTSFSKVRHFQTVSYRTNTCITVLHCPEMHVLNKLRPCPSKPLQSLTCTDKVPALPITKIVEDFVSVCLRHLGVYKEARVSELCDLLGQ